MRRATVCFSMYSDMSSLTMARSSSKRNSANARANSVFPTPVGPRKRNEPMGRLGSLRPARARRTALDTARIASSWPRHRSARPSLAPEPLFQRGERAVAELGGPVQAPPPLGIGHALARRLDLLLD